MELEKENMKREKEKERGGERMKKESTKVAERRRKI